MGAGAAANTGTSWPNFQRRTTLTLLRGSTTVATNTNWNSSADSTTIRDTSAQVGAFPLVNNDSAMVITLTPGNYTAQVTGAAGATGIALIEVYELP